MPSYCYTVLPPQIFADAADTNIAIYDKDTEKKKLTKLFIQNLATTPVKYLMNAAAISGTGVPTLVFNGILSGGTAEDDGLGGVLSLDCEDLKVVNVVVFSKTDAVRVTATKFFDPMSV